PWRPATLVHAPLSSMLAGLARALAPTVRPLTVTSASPLVRPQARARLDAGLGRPAVSERRRDDRPFYPARPPLFEPRTRRVRAGAAPGSGVEPPSLLGARASSPPRLRPELALSAAQGWPRSQEAPEPAGVFRPVPVTP